MKGRERYAPALAPHRTAALVPHRLPWDPIVRVPSKVIFPNTAPCRSVDPARSLGGRRPSPTASGGAPPPHPGPPGTIRSRRLRWVSVPTRKVCHVYIRRGGAPPLAVGSSRVPPGEGDGSYHQPVWGRGTFTRSLRGGRPSPTASGGAPHPHPGHPDTIRSRWLRWVSVPTRKVCHVYIRRGGAPARRLVWAGGHHMLLGAMWRSHRRFRVESVGSSAAHRFSPGTRCSSTKSSPPGPAPTHA